MKRRSKDDAVDEAMRELSRTIKDTDARIRHVLQMFSTNELEIITSQQKGLQTDPAWPDSPFPEFLGDDGA